MWVIHECRRLYAIDVARINKAPVPLLPHQGPRPPGEGSGRHARRGTVEAREDPAVQCLPRGPRFGGWRAVGGGSPMDGRMAGLAGGIAGAVIGVMGGLIGTYFSIKNANGPEERAFV